MSPSQPGLNPEFIKTTRSGCNWGVFYKVPHFVRQVALEFFYDLWVFIWLVVYLPPGPSYHKVPARFRLFVRVFSRWTLGFMDVYGTNRMIYSSMGRQSNRENVVPFGSLRSEPPRPIDSTLRLDMTRSTARLHVVLIHQILGVMHHDIVHALRLVCLARLKATSGPRTHWGESPNWAGEKWGKLSSNILGGSTLMRMWYRMGMSRIWMEHWCNFSNLPSSCSTLKGPVRAYLL